jgi:hypothetical protein
VENIQAVGANYYGLLLYMSKVNAKEVKFWKFSVAYLGKRRILVLSTDSQNIVNNVRGRVFMTSPASSIPVFCVCSDML